MHCNRVGVDREISGFVRAIFSSVHSPPLLLPLLCNVMTNVSSSLFSIAQSGRSNKTLSVVPSPKDTMESNPPIAYGYNLFLFF